MFHQESTTEKNFKKYFANEIASELQIRPQEAKIEFDQEQEFFAQNSRSEDTMVICGSYQKDADYANGRFISVWERKDHSFWNELFGTKESYEIVFIRVCEDINAPKTLMCQNCSFQDVNSDEVEDIRIQYKTNFADRVSFAEIFLLHIDDSWFLSVPDLSEIETEIESQIDPDGFAFLDTFTFRDPADAKSLQVSRSEMYSMEDRALIALRKRGQTVGLERFLNDEINYYSGTGITRFKESGSSSTERLALRRIDLETRFEKLLGRNATDNNLND